MKAEKIHIPSIVFLVSITVTTLVAGPLYVIFHDLTAFDYTLFIFYVLATSFSITVGYHRLFSHTTFEAHPVVQFLVLFFGAAAFEQSALKWSTLHRTHHKFVDTDEDPYNIKRGFFYAHVGWILKKRKNIDYENVKDLKKNKLVMHQHQHYQSWALTAGLVTPLVVGALAGHLLPAFIFSVCARLVLVFNSAFFINSYAHTFGESPFDTRSSAKDHWLGAVLTNGEGYHNFHHRFPNDYRNGVLWHHWDPSKWVIWTLSKLGLAKNLRMTPAVQIREARQLQAAHS